MNWAALQELTLGSILFYLFCFVFSIQLWYYCFYFLRFAFYKKNKTIEFTPPVSVIICAKNEDHNIVDFLPLIFTQDYPEFEVVVVNDCSFDNTGDILNEFSKRYSSLKIVTIKESEHHSHGKKIAVMMGVKGASNEYLLFTDADCKPSSNQWLKSMISNFTNETEIVLGYGAYEKQKGFLNKIIRFDTFIIALQYFSFSLAHKTYMGTGRNLAYKKSLFFKMKGFASHYHIESGDDDLFVNEAATKRNSRIEISIDSHTISRVKTKFESWSRQKRRHVTTFKHYNFGSKFRLIMLSTSQYLFIASFVSLLIFQFQPILVVSIFGTRLLLQILVYYKSMKALSEKDLLLFSPLLEIILLFIYPLISILNLTNKKNNWK